MALTYFTRRCYRRPIHWAVMHMPNKRLQWDVFAFGEAAPEAGRWT